MNNRKNTRTLTRYVPLPILLVAALLFPSLSHATPYATGLTNNAGATVYQTVRDARAQWTPVWVVVDGSTDGTAQGLLKMAVADAGLKVLVLPANQGKGAAVLHGLQAASQAGYSHALTMDSDGQHPASLIPAFMHASQQRPGTS